MPTTDRTTPPRSSHHADNTFSFNSLRYEPPRDLRGRTITIRFQRHTGFPPVVYHDNIRLGEATLLDPVANDRRPAADF